MFDTEDFFSAACKRKCTEAQLICLDAFRNLHVSRMRNRRTGRTRGEKIAVSNAQHVEKRTVVLWIFRIRQHATQAVMRGKARKS